MDLNSYRTLGRSGLLVSPITLGTMTFGTSGWGSSDQEAADVFDGYVEAGGSVIDTADMYAGGRSEEMVGRFVAERGLRDRLVLATKSGFFSGDAGNPHAGGNGRKHVVRALEGSLKRLGTDYIDLYWLHVWDMVTPVEEILQTLGDLVREGKIRYFGLSDGPAWYAMKAATLAQAHGVPGPIALQTEYSLVDRSIEREHVGTAREGGMGIVTWSPLAGGFLTGKYARGDARDESSGRLGGANPFGDSKFTDRNWDILDVLRSVAQEAGHTPAEVALAWAVARPATASLIVGARTPKQLASNLSSLTVHLGNEQTAQLDAASALAPSYGTMVGTEMPMLKNAVFGGASVGTDWR